MSYVPYLLILAVVCVIGGLWEAAEAWLQARRDRAWSRRMAEARQAMEAVQRANRPVSATQLHDFAEGHVPAMEVIDGE